MTTLRLLAVFLFALGPISMGAPMTIHRAADGLISGPFTHDPAPARGEEKITLTAEQIDALNAFRKAHPGARIVFDGAAFALHPLDVARAAAASEREALAAKLDAGTITAAEQKLLIRHLLRRIEKLEAARH